MDNCEFPLCKQSATCDGYCIHHAKHFAPVKVQAKPKPIRPVSKKREVLQKEYVALVKSMLKQNPNCEINATGCTGKAQGLHHKVKRTEKNLCSSENLLRACNSCNGYIEKNPLEAIKKGWSKSKHLK